MGDGLLGPEVEEGVYEDNEIPGAEDEDEAYDLRFFPREEWGCTPFGTPTITGPHGMVTKFERNPRSATSRTEYGTPTVSVDGATVCVIVPRTQVVSSSGTKTYFNWYNLCCALDCVTLLEYVREEVETDEKRTLLDPEIRCVTDWPQWALDRLLDLIRNGATLGQAVTTVQGLFGARGGAKSSNIVEIAKDLAKAPKTPRKESARRPMHPKLRGRD